MMNDKETFLKQYVLAAAQGAGERRLNVAGAIREASEAFKLIQAELKKG